MRDEALTVHLLAGCLVLNGPWGWQVVWFAVFALGWVLGWSAVRAQAKTLFVPGEAV